MRGVHPALAALLLTSIARFEKQNSDSYVVAIEGVRTADRQRTLVNEGKSWTMNSRHLTGDAVDVMVVVRLPNGAKEPWFPEAYEEFNDVVETVALEIGVPFVWGGKWKQRDLGHFELSQR